MHNMLITEAARQMALLPYRMQERVLHFINELIVAEKHGVAGKSLLKYAGHIPPDDLKTMSEAIERDCGEIDSDEW